MDHVIRRTVIIDIDEHEGRTHAVARLLTRDTDRLVGIGSARLGPAGRHVPEVGNELATARALAELARKLLGTASAHVEQSTDEPERLKL